MHRAYRLKQHANAGKQSKAIETVRAYRKTAEKIARVQWRFFYGTGGGFDKNLDIKHIASFLSERYKQTCQYQVVGILASFLSNRQNDFVDLVKRSSLEENTRHKLLVINAWNLWQRTAPFTSLKHKLQIDAADLLLARKLFKDVLHRHRRPSFKKINMALDNKVAVITAKVPDKAKAFDYWIRLSTLDKGVPSYLPLSTNGYFESTPGRRRNFCQVNLSEDRKLSVTFIKDVLKKAYVPEIPKMALDLGLTTLFAINRPGRPDRQKVLRGSSAIRSADQRARFQQTASGVEGQKQDIRYSREQDKGVHAERDQPCSEPARGDS